METKVINSAWRGQCSQRVPASCHVRMWVHCHYVVCFVKDAGNFMQHKI